MPRESLDGRVWVTGHATDEDERKRLMGTVIERHALDGLVGDARAGIAGHELSVDGGRVAR